MTSPVPLEHWNTKLAPHVPLVPGDAHFVQRSEATSVEIAQWVRVGQAPILVGGPAGAGKSTELAHATALLRSERATCLVQLDRMENMRRLAPERMMQRLVLALTDVIEREFHASLSGGLAERVTGVRAALANLPYSMTLPVATVVRSAAGELERAASRPVALLIDGLEKCPPGPATLELFDALATIADAAALVVVIPWHVAFGPAGGDEVVRAGERLLSTRALDVTAPDPVGDHARASLRKMFCRRIGWEPTDLHGENRRVVDGAVTHSGGIPRTFLQLMASAAGYAQIRGRVLFPSDDDLQSAIRDQQDSFRRLLLPNDVDAICQNEGTSGTELTLDQRIRLLAHGLLLERLRSDGPILEVHPLARPAVRR
jgi:hypothetical protein